MSDSREKNRETSDVLPRPELNPLVNPVLEHNLGRWAEVYFTSPPEKREQAIIDLLMELQATNEFEPDQQSQPVAPTLPRESSPQESKPLNLTGMACRACQFENLAGQHYCGGCGAALLGNDTPLAAERQAQPAPVRISATPDPPSTPLIDHPGETESDVRWLREKAFSQWDEVEPPAHRGKMLFLAVLTLTVLFGVVAYTYWPSRDRNVQSLPADGSLPPAAAVQQPAPVESVAPSTPENPPALEKAPVHAPSHKLPSPHRLASAAPAAGPGDGSQELLLAEQSLDGKNGVRDSAQAAKLLWKAVGKQNAQASLLLSDLYARGDGVAKNCDQARLLLVAAAKKGTPAAAQQLHSLESSGCH